MRKCSLCTVGILLIGFWNAAASPNDTARLAAHFRAVRGDLWLSAKHYKSLQAEYLVWIESRVEAGGTLESMNRELKTAGLLLTWTHSADEMFKSHAGYLEPIKNRLVQGTKEAFAIEARVYKGAGCSIDVTAVLYERSPLTRLAEINASPGEQVYAYYLSGLDISGKDANGRRLVASGWAISNCTSAWNGKRIRIDRLNRSSVENVLACGLSARDRDPDETVSARIQGDLVTFGYDGAIGDDELLCRPAIARYRIAEGPVRELPIALTRAGFIHEWLSMADADPSRWGEPQALGMRRRVAQAVEKHNLEWVGIARCGGAPPVWEVAVRLDNLERLYVFRISGARATELRMLRIGDKLTPSCVQLDVKANLNDVSTELPW